MNYSRHFSSEAPAGTAAAHYYLNKDGTASSATFNASFAIEKEQILGAAIERTLKDCGLDNCKYYGTVSNKPVSYLCLDDTADGKPGFYIYVAASYIYFYLGYCGTSADTIITHAASVTATAGATAVRITNTPFSTATLVANTFDTYIKVVGDTESTFYLAFTTYGTTAEVTPSIVCIANMIDKRNSKEIYGFYFGAKTFQQLVPLYKENNVYVISETAPNIITAYTLGTYVPQNNYIMLINQLSATYPHIWFVDGFIRPSTFTDQSFYEVDGDVYYTTAFTIFKCTTVVTPG